MSKRIGLFVLAVLIFSMLFYGLINFLYKSTIVFFIENFNWIIAVISIILSLITCFFLLLHVESILENAYIIIIVSSFIAVFALLFYWLFVGAKENNFTVLIVPAFLSAIGFFFTNKIGAISKEKDKEVTIKKDLYERMINTCYENHSIDSMENMSKLNGKVEIYCTNDIVELWKKLQIFRNDHFGINRETLIKLIRQDLKKHK